MVFGKYIDNICDATIERILKDDDEDGTEVSFSSEIDAGSSGECFRAKGYKVTSHGKTYYMAIFADYTETRALAKRLEDEDTIVAYAMIDNLDELMQYVQELYDTAASDVETILRKHMEAVGGIVREYANNKFICVFAAKYLEKFEEDKFSVLDEVREIYVGETSMPVTISIGIAKISGTLYEKERVTQSALDLALQRGGDQVVVKSADGVDFYGGKTKAVQKRTKVRSRVIAGEFMSLLKKSSNVIVMGHRFADFDAFASCLAVARLATFCGVKVNIVADKNDRNLAPCFARLEEYPEYGALVHGQSRGAGSHPQRYAGGCCQRVREQSRFLRGSGHCQQREQSRHNRPPQKVPANTQSQTEHCLYRAVGVVGVGAAAPNFLNRRSPPERFRRWRRICSSPDFCSIRNALRTIRERERFRPLCISAAKAQARPMRKTFSRRE